MTPLRSDIVSHLEALYKSWEARIYPSGRSSPPAILEILFEEGDSGYRKRGHRIIICIPEGNLDDFTGRIGHISTKIDRWRRSVSEIELMHEMMHERQFVELKSANPEGRALFAKYGPRFSGPGHDELFYSAIAISAVHLGVTPDDLVLNL